MRESPPDLYTAQTLAHKSPQPFFLTPSLVQLPIRAIRPIVLGQLFRKRPFFPTKARDINSLAPSYNSTPIILPLHFNLF